MTKAHLRDLKPDPNNARRHNPRNVGMVERSIQSEGFGRAILLANDGTIIAGNATIEAAASAGIENVRVIESDGTEVIAVKRTDVAPESERFYKLAIADNRAAELASWDVENLQQVFDAGVDANEFWFPEELSALFAEAEAETVAGLTDPDAVPEPPKEPITKPGDLWLLGDHRLLCADCRDFGSVDRLFDGAKANVVITSPPYASRRKYDETSGFKPVPSGQYAEWFRDVAANVMAVLAEDGSYFLNIKEHCEDGQRSLYVKDLTIAHVRDWGWKFIDELCWQRSALPGLFGPRFKNEWEPVFHFARGNAKFRPEHVLLERDLSGLRTYDETDGGVTRTADYNGKGERGGVRSKNFSGALPGNVIVVSKSGGVDHGAQFPVGLPDFFVKAFSDPGDIAFDPFMGSGTTLIAAEQTGRVGYGMEISPAYCDVIVNRWQDFTGQTAMLERQAD